jgi:hypothetical protein
VSAATIIGVLSVIATIAAALIQRSWDIRGRRIPRFEHSLEFGPIHEDLSFTVDEVVKVLDLRMSPGRGSAPGTATLTDTYLVRRHTTKGNGFVSAYSTSGALSAECVSHPDAHIWGDFPSGHMNINKAMAVSLSQLACNHVTRIINRITYTGAYDGPDKEIIETHIDRPTRAITFIIFFPEQYPCSNIRASHQIGRRENVLADGETGPMLLRGLMAYWRIVPDKGTWLPSEARYRIEWDWAAAQGRQRRRVSPSP